MDKRPTKRRGPIHWLAARSRVFWFANGLLLPVLYLARYGPVTWSWHKLNQPERMHSVMKIGYVPVIWAMQTGWLGRWYIRYINWCPPSRTDSRKHP